MRNSFGQNGAGIWHPPQNNMSTGRQQFLPQLQKYTQDFGGNNGLQSLYRKGQDFANNIMNKGQDYVNQAQNYVNDFRNRYNGNENYGGQTANRMTDAISQMSSKLGFTDFTKNPLYSDFIKPSTGFVLDKIHQASQPKKQTGWSRFVGGLKNFGHKVHKFFKPVFNIGSKIAPIAGGLIGGPGGAAIGGAVGKLAGLLGGSQ